MKPTTTGSRRLLFTLFAAVALAAATPASAQITAAKVQPWEWSLEERLTGLKAASGAETIRGSEHPELFLAHQLFDGLMSQLYGGDEETRQAWRQIYAAEATTLLGPPDQVWETLESLSREYLWSLQRARELAQGLDEATPTERKEILARIKEVQAPQCALRFEALEAARRALGPESFDRFLYTAVASRRSKTYTTPINTEMLATTRWVAGGCR